MFDLGYHFKHVDTIFDRVFARGKRRLCTRLSERRRHGRCGSSGCSRNWVRPTRSRQAAARSGGAGDQSVRQGARSRRRRDAVFDSVAICQFLADRHGHLTFKAGTIERAHQDSFTQFAVDDIESALWTAAKHTFVLPEEYRVPA